MDALHALIHAFSPEENRQLRKFIAFRSLRKGRKDLKLLDLLRKKPEDKEVLFKALYPGETNKHPFYQLRSYLKGQIEDFIVQQTQTQDHNFYLFKILAIARYLFRKKSYELAWKYMEEAERLAQEHEQFELLNLVYSIQIEYAWTQFAPPIQELIKRRTQHLELAREDGELNAALSLVRHKLTEAHAAGIALNVNQIVHPILRESSLSPVSLKKPSLRFKLAMIVHLNLKEQKDFTSLFDYIAREYEEMETSGSFDKYNHEHKLELIKIACSSSLKSRNYTKCKHYLDLLYQEIHRYDPIAHFLTGWYMISVDYLVCTGAPEEAVKLLLRFQDLQGKRINIEDSNYLFTNLAAVYFIQGDYARSADSIALLQKGEKLFIQQNGIEGVIRKYLIECVVQYQLKDYDYVGYRIKSIERKYQRAFKETSLNREWAFLTILKSLIKTGTINVDRPLIREAVDRIKAKSVEIGDSEFVNFTAWVQSLQHNSTYYQEFLSLVSDTKRPR